MRGNSLPLTLKQKAKSKKGHPEIQVTTQNTPGQPAENPQLSRQIRNPGPTRGKPGSDLKIKLTLTIYRFFDFFEELPASFGAFRDCPFGGVFFTADRV